MIRALLNRSNPLNRFSDSLKLQFQRRFARWIRRRQGDDTLPLTLRSRRLYILPTSVGITYAIVCFSMLLGSMNYNNSMGFALTFLLASTGLIAMHRCHQNLSGLRIKNAQAQSVFAGETINLQLLLQNPAASTRYELRARTGANTGAVIDIGATQDDLLQIPIPSTTRGWVLVERFRIQSRFPLALLQCWCWLYVDVRCLVWPAPAEDPPPRPETDAAESGQHGKDGDDDFAGLRDYRDGDSPRLIAWKAFARTDELKARQFEGGSQSTRWIDYATATAEDLEHRLSILCRWVLDADANGSRFGLRLPGTVIDPDRGRRHRDQCLDALAVFGLKGADNAL